MFDWREWHTWFAWHPILIDNSYIWLEFIERRLTYEDVHNNTIYEYRKIEQ